MMILFCLSTIIGCSVDDEIGGSSEKEIDSKFFSEIFYVLNGYQKRTYIKYLYETDSIREEKLGLKRLNSLFEIRDEALMYLGYESGSVELKYEAYINRVLALFNPEQQERMNAFLKEINSDSFDSMTISEAKVRVLLFHDFALHINWELISSDSHDIKLEEEV